MRFKIDIKGIEETKNRLHKIANSIERTDEVLREVGELGWQYAQTVAPEYSGALKAAIINFQENKETWIILSSQPYGDAGPTNVYFEQGTYPNPRDPNTLRFMTQTADFLRNEFSQRLNLFISNVIQNS
jgi:hypothetical protein